MHNSQAKLASQYMHMLSLLKHPFDSQKGCSKLLMVGADERTINSGMTGTANISGLNEHIT